MAFDKIKKFINSDFEENGTSENEYYGTTKDGFKEMTNGGTKMILLEPRAFSESQQIADYLKARNTVVVNLKRVTPDQAKRIIDFLGGTLYAIGGTLQKLGNGIFLCTPNNVSVEGKMSDGEKAKVKKEEQQPDEYEW